MFFCHQSFVLLSDSSKQRARLRKKIGTEKAGLEETISRYNGLVTDHPIQKEEIEKGSFPWNENSTDTGKALARTDKFGY